MADTNLWQRKPLTKKNNLEGSEGDENLSLRFIHFRKTGCKFGRETKRIAGHDQRRVLV
jgi:hypothetical protein